MAVLAASADGNLTSSGTWSLVDSTSYLNSETGSEVLTTAYSGTRSSTFTPGAITIDGIGVKLSVRTGTTGTISVSLYNNTLAASVAGTEVTIDCADLPGAVTAAANGGWIFFKFAAPVLLLAGNGYKVEAKTSSATQVSLFRDATTDNISRYLRTTTNQAPTTGDDMIIAKEWTAAATGAGRTVTMESTSATDYGSNSTSAVLPAQAICLGGSLVCGTSSSTNYVLRLSGHLIVYAGGTCSFGTTGTRIPRSSTAILEFDCAADGDFGAIARNNSTFNGLGLSRTSGKDVSWCRLNTDEAASQTVLGVDSDTGWLSGDSIVIAPTTQTRAQAELRTLASDASSTTVTVSSGLTNAHSGTSPTQARVILLTRNVKIRSVSATAMTFFFADDTATVSLEWVEFRYIGVNATGKRGLEIDTASGGSTTVSHCSIYDCEATACIVSNTSSTGVTISNLVLYNTATAFSHAGGLSSSTNSITNVISILSTGFSITGWGADTIDDIVCIGSSSNPSLSGSMIPYKQYGLLEYHSGATPVTSTLTGNQASISLKSWRNTTYGLNINGNLANLVIDSFETFGNASGGITMTAAVTGLTVYNFVTNADTSFASSVGLNLASSNSAALTAIKFVDPDFSTVSGIKTAHGIDISAGGQSLTNVDIVLINPKFGAATELSGQGNLPLYYQDAFYGGIKILRKDQNDGENIAWFGNVTISSDSTIYRTASPSLRMAPINATVKARSQTFFVNVNDGQTCTPTVYVRESVVGDGTDYGGNRARLILKRNDALGITSDTVIDTASGSSEGAFEALTGTTSAVTDDGVLEFYIDCDGTTGWINIDDFSATVA